MTQQQLAAFLLVLVASWAGCPTSAQADHRQMALKSINQLNKSGVSLYEIFPLKSTVNKQIST
jgi:hypothetical protein